MTVSELKEKVGNNFVIVDFFATWCGPCGMLSKVMEQIEDKYKIIKVDIDESEELARLNGINVVPTIQIYKNGSVLATKSGFMDKNELVNWIERYK